MTDKKVYLWLVLGLALALVLTFQPVLAGSTSLELERNVRSELGGQSILAADEAAVPQALVDPVCTLPETTNVISYWPLNETSGESFTDTIGGHNGACSGEFCPSPVSGTNAGGQFFISTDYDAIEVATSTDYDFLPADSFSASVWVKTTQNCEGNKVYLGRFGNVPSEGRWWLGCVPGGTARFHMRDSTDIAGTAVGSTTINDGEWHYLTGVWDGTDMYLYVDGALDATDPAPGFTGNFNSVKPVTIGAFDLSGGGFYSNGALDEAAVFNTALSSTFISNYYGSCNFESLYVNDVTFDTTVNTGLEITAAELLDGSSGAGPVAISAIDSGSEKGGTVTGTIPGGPFTYTPPLDYVGTDFFTFLVDDGTNTAYGSAVITQEAPAVTQPANQSDYEGAAVSLQIVATDPQDDAMTYEISGQPGDLTIDPDTGLISGLVSATAFDSSPYDPVTVTVTDSNGFATAVEFIWTIIENEIPVVEPIPDQANAEGETITPLQVSAGDGDGDTLTYGATNLPPGLTINADTGLISGMVGATASLGSPYSVIVTVDDGFAAPVEAPFTWTISGENRPPVVTNPGSQSSVEGALISLQVTASDPDGDALTYSATGLPAGLSINSSSGLISGTITAGASSFSPFTVTVRATDPGTLYDEVAFSWVVSEKPQNVFLPLVYKK